MPLDLDLLRRNSDDRGTLSSQLDEEIAAVQLDEAEAEVRRSELEREMAVKTSEIDQLERLVVQIGDQIKAIKLAVGEAVPGTVVDKSRTELAQIESLTKEVEHVREQQESALWDLERAIAEHTRALGGIERRVEAVEAFLNAFDADVASVSASRDLKVIVEQELTASRRLEFLSDLKAKAAEVERDQRELEENQALLAAAKELQAAEDVVKSVQSRQRRMQARGAQFKEVHEALVGMQNATAEIVLNKIRKPVSLLFHAMTAGCPWDIEFRLDGGKVGAMLTDGSTKDVEATSILNSAYLNIAAISLRVALASQQKWTRLRTVVLDDPILEMDNLTQSALIDGIEAILTSHFAPWSDMQLVLTTWSEDFAIMAAHKLGHLNNNQLKRDVGSSGAMGDDFVIHRLALDPDGSVTSQRHAPQWRTEVSAA